MVEPVDRLVELFGGKGVAVFHPTGTPTFAAKPDVGWTTRSLSTFANTELPNGKGFAVFHGAAHRTTIEPY